MKPMTQQELFAGLAQLTAAGLEFADCITFFGEADEDPYVLAARQKQRDGELEIGSPTVVSHGNDAGAYVMAWIWITDSEAGTDKENNDGTPAA